MLASGAYHYLPEMKDRKEAIERLFDIELEYTFSTSEQAWAAFGFSTRHSRYSKIL